MQSNMAKQQHKAHFKHRATAVPNSIERIQFDFSMAVAWRLKPSPATAVQHSSTWFQMSRYCRTELNSKIINTLEYI